MGKTQKKYDNLSFKLKDDYLKFYNNGYSALTISLENQREKTSLINFLRDNLDNENYLLLYAIMIFFDNSYKNKHPEALDILKRLARKKYAEALYVLSLDYEMRYGAKNKKTTTLYLKSAKQNCALAQKRLGDIYFYGRNKKRNIKKGLKYYLKAFKQKERNSMFIIGLFYYDGIFLKQNFEKAYEIFSFLEKLNHKDACYYLGEMYYYNKGVTQNFEDSFKYYEKSAKLNHRIAQFKLALIYQEGIIVKKDLNQALYWYSNALMNDYEIARVYIAKIYLSDEMFFPNRAIAILDDKSIMHYDEVRFLLGRMYYEGLGCLENKELGLIHLNEAKRLNNKEAITYIDSLK